MAGPDNSEKVRLYKAAYRIAQQTVTGKSPAERKRIMEARAQVRTIRKAVGSNAVLKTLTGKAVGNYNKATGEWEKPKTTKPAKTEKTEKPEKTYTRLGGKEGRGGAPGVTTVKARKNPNKKGTAEWVNWETKNKNREKEIQSRLGSRTRTTAQGGIGRFRGTASAAKPEPPESRNARPTPKPENPVMGPADKARRAAAKVAEDVFAKSDQKTKTGMTKPKKKKKGIVQQKYAPGR